MELKQLYNDICGILSKNPNSDTQFEANCLIEFVTGKKKNDMLFCDIDADTAEKITILAQKRQTGYPLQYILGVWDFFDMELFVGEGVLIPRQDTETVCEEAFKIIDKFACPAVLDLCSGSGCIALSIKKFFPNASVAAVEKSEKAYSYLVKNIEKTSLSVLPILADITKLDKNVEEESFDVIISNPPYINPDLQGKLQKEVEYEPSEALFAKDDGLYFYKYIARNYKDALKYGGYLIFEYGYDQKEKVKNILLGEKYIIVKEIVDLSGNARGIIAKK